MSFMANLRPSSSVNVEEVTANIKRLMQQDVDNITQRLRHEHEQQIATLEAELAKERLSVSTLQQTTKEVEEEREKAEAERDKTQRNGLSIAYYLDKELYQILRSIIPTYNQPAAPSFQSASIHDRFDRLTAHVDTLNKHIGPECSCNDDIRAAIEARNRVELGNGNQTQVSDRESQSAANASISSAYETVRVERDSLKSANQHLIGQRDNATAGLESATTKLQAAELKIRELEQNLLDARTAVSSEACTAFQASQRQVVRLEEQLREALSSSTLSIQQRDLSLDALQTAQKQYQIIQAERDSLRSELERLSQLSSGSSVAGGPRIQAPQQPAGDTVQHREDLAKELEIARTDRDLLQHRLNEVVAMRNLAFDTVNSSHKEIETLRKSLVETKEQLSERRAVAESLSIAFNKSDSEKQGLQLQLEQLTQDSQKTSAALQASEQANLAFQQRLDDLEASVSAERQRAEQTLQSSQDQLQAAVGEHRRLQQQLDEVTDAHKTASAAVELMKRESMSLEALGKDNTNFREDMSSGASAGTSNQQLHFQKKEESEELRGATSELATTQRKLVSAERQLELLQQDVETLRTKLSKEGYHSKKASMKAWSTEVGRATLRDILTETNEQLKDTQEQLGQIQAKLASTEQELHGQTFDAAMALLEAEQTHGTLERDLRAQIHELERSALLRQEEAVQGTEAQLEQHATRVRELEEMLSQKESDLQETVIEVKNILQRMEFETEKWSRSRRKAEKLFARWNILTPEEREMAEERLKTSLKSSSTKHQRQPADT